MTAERVKQSAGMLPDTAPLVPVKAQRPKQARQSRLLRGRDIEPNPFTDDFGQFWMRAIPVPVRERILKLYDDGESTAEIAELLGYCIAAVRRVRQQFQVRATKLEPRDTLLLYTDGICEAQNAAGEELGLQSLRELIRERKMREPCEVVQHCRALLDGFRGDGERLDDETMLAIQFVPVVAQSESRRHAYV